MGEKFGRSHSGKFTGFVGAKGAVENIST